MTYRLYSKIGSFILIYNLFVVNLVCAQDVFFDINSLPVTKEVKAPEFNTVKEYFFKIDSVNNKLIIQDLRKSKKGKVHFYQWVYEIPLNQLNSKSFSVYKNSKNEIKILIKAINKSNSIAFYMFQDNKVSSIMSANTIGLGNWPYSKILFQKISKSINSISNFFPKNVSSSKTSKSKSINFKYISDNVVSKNATMDKDLSIGNGYHFEQIINENNFNLYPKITRRIKTTLKKQKISYQYPLPVFIYTNKEGVIESIIVINKPSKKYIEIDLSNLGPIKIGVNNKPKKYVFLLK